MNSVTTITNPKVVFCSENSKEKYYNLNEEN